MLRLTFFDGTGLDFCFSLVTKHKFLFAISIIYLCGTSFGIVNGILGIFGSVFRKASNEEFEKKSHPMVQHEEPPTPFISASSSSTLGGTVNSSTSLVGGGGGGGGGDASSTISSSPTPTPRGRQGNNQLASQLMKQNSRVGGLSLTHPSIELASIATTAPPAADAAADAANVAAADAANVAAASAAPAPVVTLPQLMAEIHTLHTRLDEQTEDLRKITKLLLDMQSSSSQQQQQQQQQQQLGGSSNSI